MYYDTHLAHHGILGMKWGVRRYQNEDGSLTDAGKKRAEKRYLWKGPDNFRYNRANRLADKGLRRRSRGETIGDNNMKAHYGALAVGVAATMGLKYMQSKNINKMMINVGGRHIGDLNQQNIIIGAAAATGLIYGRNYIKNRQIRTSYQRDRYGKKARWAG